MEFIPNTKERDFFLKVVITGKDSIGKTIFTNRLRSNDDYYKFKTYPIDYIQTIGVEIIGTSIKFYNKTFKLQIWDLSGHILFENIVSAYYKGANIILIFFDSFDRSSFEKAKSIYKERIQDKFTKDKICLLIRSKYGNSQKELKDFVSDEEALEFADKNNLLFKHISCFEKYETGIKELIMLFLNQYLKKSKN